jgi:hypothetical protein
MNKNVTWKLQQASSNVKNKLKKKHCMLHWNSVVLEDLKILIYQLGEKYERLLQNVNFGLQLGQYQKKIKFISLVSHSWSVKKVTPEFGVSQYIVRKGRVSQKTCGILPKIEKQGQPLMLRVYSNDIYSFCHLFLGITKFRIFCSKGSLQCHLKI